MKKTRVVVVVTGLGGGGAATALLNVLAVLNDRGFECRLISLVPIDEADRVHGTGVACTSLELTPGRVSAAAVARLAAHLRRHRPDVVVGWQYHGNVAASVARFLAGGRYPMVWSVRHSIADLSTDKRLTRWLIRRGAWLSRWTAAVTYCSRTSARQHEGIGYDRTKTVVIPNGIDCERFRPRPEIGARIRAELAIPPDRVVIGQVARFHPMKDHVNLVRASARLLAAAHPVHLVMVGSDVDARNHALRQAIREAGIGERVTLLGQRGDIAELMSSFDILALSSSAGEAFPNVLGEAMASGVPCVATDVGDCAWIVGDTGVIVPPRESAALASGLSRLVESGSEVRRNLGEAARARVLENFDVTDVVERYQSLYERLCYSYSRTSCPRQSGRDQVPSNEL